ncbi:hypothetical protein MLD38_019858 [Melastoma candidum]|uniref:Uncharacterized protein n=1 Tax=Melastoma candidum TaxID=119954 RepID=A0ACB9QBF1_9MYRT|nr:hypothetical protein MLD38_019858 [Melastoma candidum]
MKNMQYAEDLVREFLAFRGFTFTLQAFETKLASEIGRGFQCLSSSVDTVLVDTLSRLETSILRYYIVSAVKSGRRDKVVDFFGTNGNDLMLKDQEWTPWFAMNLCSCSVYEEFEHGSSVLSLLFKGVVSLEKSNVSHLKKQVEQLNSKVAQLQLLLEEKETQLGQLRSRLDAYAGLSNSSSQSINIREEDTTLPSDNQETQHPAGPRLSGNEQEQSSSNSEVQHDDITGPNSKAREPEREIDGEEEFPEVCVDFQETFLGLPGAVLLPLETILLVLQWMARSGYGRMIRLPQHQEMQLYTAGPRSCHLTGGVNLIACFLLELVMVESKHGMLMQNEKLGLCVTNCVEHEDLEGHETGSNSLVDNPGRWRDPDCCTFKPEMAMDVHGRSLLVTSGTGRAPIYPISSDGHGLMTLPHTASITTVDWHPSLPIYLTGSADNSVRVTSML